MTAYKNIIILSLPVFFFRLLVTLNSFAGVIFISRLSKEALAASLIAYSVYMAVFLVSFTLLISVGISISRFFGARQHDKIAEVFQGGLGLSFLIACIAAFLLWNFKYVLGVANQNPTIIALVDGYLKYTALGIFASLWVCVFNQLNNAIKRTRVIHVANFCILPLSVAMGYCFVFGKYGFPCLGMPGYALGTTIANVCVALGLWVYHLREGEKGYLVICSLRSYFRWDIHKKLVKMGVPISVQSASELIAFSVSAIFMGWFGSNAMAAQQIVLQVTILANMFAFSIGQGASVAVGHAIGEKNKEMMVSLMKKGMKLALLFSSAIAVIFLIFPKIIIGLYIAHSSSAYVDVYPIARIFLVIASIMLVFDAVRFFSGSVLRVMHDFKFPMFTTLICFGCFALPLAYLFSMSYAYGPVGIRLGFLAAVIIAAAVISMRLRAQVSSKYAAGQEPLLSKH